MNTGNNIYFNHKDHLYYFGEGSVPALAFVERDKKKGVMTIYNCGQGGYGGVLFSSYFFPLLYDEMLLTKVSHLLRWC